MPYFDIIWALFFIVITFLTFYSWSGHKARATKWSLWATFAFIAFRAPVVGADTWDYVRYLTGERNYYNEDVRELETFFVFYRHIVCSITSSRLFVMIINTLVSMSPVLYLFRKYSFNVPMSILFFFYLGSEHLYFVGLRQVIGNSFILWALIYYLETVGDMWSKKEKKTKKLKCLFLLLTASLVGYGFHTTSVIYGFVMILLLLIPMEKKVIAYSLILSTLIFSVFLQEFNVYEIMARIYNLDVETIERVSSYLVNDAEKDNLVATIVARKSIVGLIAIYFMDNKYLNHIFTKLFVFGIVFYNLFYLLPMVDRFAPAFILFGCVCITWIFGSKYKTKKLKPIINLITIMMILFFTRSIFIQLNNWDPTSNAKMHPYYFFFQDYKDHPSVKYGI